MSFILDTSTLIEIENGNTEIITKINQLKDAPQSDLYITIFNFTEFYYGAMNKNERNKSLVKERLSKYLLLNTTQRTAEIFCEIWHDLIKRGKLIPQFDVFIAAFAIEHDLTLITLDEHFNEVSGLKTIIL